MQGGETELLEILIAKDRSDRPGKVTEYDNGDIFLPVSSESFSGGSKAAVKRGILKKGAALRRASSMTSGEPSLIVLFEAKQIFFKAMAPKAGGNEKKNTTSQNEMQSLCCCLPALQDISTQRRKFQVPLRQEHHCMRTGTTTSQVTLELCFNNTGMLCHHSLKRPATGHDPSSFPSILHLPRMRPLNPRSVMQTQFHSLYNFSEED